MTTRQQQQNKNQRSQQQENQGPAYEYRGFDDWVEIFRSGEQTDSQGRTAVFTNADLDSMVKNHRPSPIVIGHPKTDSPAWGWSKGLKRVGNKLYGKYKDVVASFEKMVENKQFPERSIKIEQLEEGGFRLVHTGFLGAVAPAIEGMERMAFSQPSGECFEFSGEWRITSKFTRLFRNLKNHLISEKGQEVADNVIPEWELQGVSDAVAEQRIEERSESAFSQQNDKGGQEVAGITQEQLDQAVKDALEKGKTEGQQAAQQAFSAQAAADKNLADAKAFVNKLVSEDKKLTPAQAIGLPEFMAQLKSGESEFRFSSGEGATQQTIKQEPYQYFSAFLEGLGSHGLLDSLDHEELDHVKASEFVSGSGKPFDEYSVKVDKAAREYMSKNPGVSYIDAADAVSSEVK